MSGVRFDGSSGGRWSPGLALAGAVSDARWRTLSSGAAAPNSHAFNRPMSVPPALAELSPRATPPSESIEYLRARAASELVDARVKGFDGARAQLSSIAREHPHDWETQACLAFIAWCDGQEDPAALSAMRKHAPERTEVLLRIREIVERTLAECAFAAPPIAPNERTAIVVPGKELTRDEAMDDDLRERMRTALELARACPNAPIVLSGGPTVGKTAECDVMADWLVEHGIARERLLLDGLSTVTTANALRTESMLRGHPDVDSIRLVTAATHMRRASVIFAITLLQASPRITLMPVIAGGKVLDAPAGRNERVAVYLDAMRASGLLAYRGRPRFYTDMEAIGDDIPGDPGASVRVELSAPHELGETPAWREVVKVTDLQRGELVRGAEGALLARLLSAYDVLPSQRIDVYEVNADNPEKAVLDALAELGLKHTKIDRAKDRTGNTGKAPGPNRGAAPRLSVHIDGDSVEALKQTRAKSANTAAPSPWRLPLMGADPVADQDQAQRPPVTLVIGEPRFVVSQAGVARLNGTVHAVDLKSVSERADASCDVVRLRTDDWRLDWKLLGDEAARVLRAEGRLIVTTGKKPRVPREAIIETLKTCGFDEVFARATTPVETPFHPVISDPAAGGVTFECTRRALPKIKPPALEWAP